MEKKYYKELSDSGFAKKRAEEILRRRSELASKMPEVNRGDRVIKEGATGLGEKLIKVPGTREEINTKEVQKLISGSDFVKNIEEKRLLNKAIKAGLKGGTKALSAIAGPIGGIAAALASGDASAALPAGFEIEGAGPRVGSLEAVMQDPDATQEDRKKAYETMLRRNALQDKRRMYDE